MVETSNSEFNEGGASVSTKGPLKAQDSLGMMKNKDFTKMLNKGGKSLTLFTFRAGDPQSKSQKSEYVPMGLRARYDHHQPERVQRQGKEENQARHLNWVHQRYFAMFGAQLQGIHYSRSKWLRLSLLLWEVSFDLFRRETIIKLLKHIIAEAHKRNLPVFGISKANLRDFTTTERDYNRGFSRYPPTIVSSTFLTRQFRNWDEDILEDQSRKILEKEEAAESDINEIDLDKKIEENLKAKYG